MEQRPLRLGDLVDDYCPRERRVTDHAIVAIVNDSIRQTRCTACDTEHPFKGGRAPSRRTKPAVADQPADNSGGQLVTPGAQAAGAASTNGHHDEPAIDAAIEPEPEGADAGTRESEPLWSGHRPLIRATLPRIEGEPPPSRPIPEFTIYQRHGRGARGRGGAAGWTGGQNGNGNGSRERRPGFGGHGQGQGHGRRRHGKRRPR
jgi:hypothetical protein